MSRRLSYRWRSCDATQTPGVQSRRSATIRALIDAQTPDGSHTPRILPRSCAQVTDKQVTTLLDAYRPAKHLPARRTLRGPPPNRGGDATPSWGCDLRAAATRRLHRTSGRSSTPSTSRASPTPKSRPTTSRALRRLHQPQARRTRRDPSPHGRDASPSSPALLPTGWSAWHRPPRCICPQPNADAMVPISDRRSIRRRR